MIQKAINMFKTKSLIDISFEQGNASLKPSVFQPSLFETLSDSSDL